MSYPLEEIVEALKFKLDEISDADFVTANHASLLEIAVAIQNSCAENELVTPFEAQNVEEHVREINAVEAVINLYSQKISAARNDNNISDDERRRKIEYLERLLNREIVDIEHG